MSKYLKIAFPILIVLILISKLVKKPSDYLYSAHIKFSNGDFKGAIDDYSKAIELDSTNGKVYYDRGILKDHVGDKIGACQDWKKSRKLGFKKAFEENIIKYCD